MHPPVPLSSPSRRVVILDGRDFPAIQHNEPKFTPPFDCSASALRLRTLANVAGVEEQQLWHSTLDAMSKEPDAKPDELEQIRAWITSGVTLDLLTQPDAIDHSNTYSVQIEQAVVRQRIKEYIDFRALVALPADHPCPRGIQPLHVIIKPDRKPRLVVDLSRNLNDHLKYEYFSYTTVSQAVEQATPGCWFSKLDLSNCFLSFPLHPEAMPYFIFRFDGQLYQFTRMPFGLSSAPRICTQLLSVPEFAMRLWGVDRSARYLDDTLLTDDDRQQAERSLLIAQHALTRFGLVINPDKTVGPAQQLAFLGIQLDSVQQTMSCTPERLTEIRALSVQQTMSCTPERLTEIRALIKQASPSRQLRLKQLQRLIGKLSFAATVLPGARPFLHRMTSLAQQAQVLRRQATARQSPECQPSLTLASALTSRPPKHRSASTASCAAISSSGATTCDRWDGRQRWRSAYRDPYTFATDASLSGFGFYVESVPGSSASAAQEWPQHLRVGSGFCGNWSASDAHLHTCSGQMTWCEMFAVLAALFTYRDVLRDSTVLFRLDYQPDVYTLNRQATRSVRLAGLLRDIYHIAVDYNICIRAEHRPGVDNVLADFLSRTPLRRPADIVAAWPRDIGYSAAIPLLYVSVVHSRRFGTTQSRDC